MRLFLDYLAIQKEGSKYTTRNYGNDLADFALWWDNEGNPNEELAPVAIDEEDLRRWKGYLKSESIGKEGEGRIRKAGSVNTKMATLKSFLSWCHRRGVIPAMPELPKQVASAPRAVKALDEKEQVELLREARIHGNKRTWPTVYVMIETGLRLAELVALRRKDLVMTPRSGELLVREGKGGKSRTLPINPEIRRAFKSLLGPGSDPEDWVFTSQRRVDPKDKKSARKPLTGRGIQEVLDRLKERLGWGDLHPHMLRHTFGMNLRRAGTDWTVIARLMGHASVVTTMMCYGTPAEKDLVKAMNRHGHTDDD